MLTIILGLHSETTGTLIPIFWRLMRCSFTTTFSITSLQNIVKYSALCYSPTLLFSTIYIYKKCRAMYSAFSKPAWALCLSWIIVSCFYGYGGTFFTDFA